MSLLLFFGSAMKSLLKGGLISLVRLYRFLISPCVHQCRFTPTCSQYALKALQTHSLSCALRLILGRLMRCRPRWRENTEAVGRAWGYDPVPEPNKKQ